MCLDLFYDLHKVLKNFILEDKPPYGKLHVSVNQCILLFLPTVVGCVVTPINPPTLTVTGGVLKYGTKNVMIQCNCTDKDGMVIDVVRWHNPDGIRLVAPASPRFNSSIPHITTVTKYDRSNPILVIPTFTYYYTGVYTCGRRKVYPPGRSNATINLTLYGELISKCHPFKVTFSQKISTYESLW